MAEEQVYRIEHATTEMMNDIDKSHLRDIQAGMYKCANTCCLNKTASVEEVNACVKECSYKMEVAQQFVQNEVNQMQDRLRRCLMTCNDSLNDKVGSNPTPQEITKHTSYFEGCSKECVDAYISLIPNVRNRVKKALNRQEI